MPRPTQRQQGQPLPGAAPRSEPRASPPARAVAAVAALALAGLLAPGALAARPHAPAATPPAPRALPATPLPSGLVLPYPLDRVFRGFGPCLDGERTHRAIDIGGVGPDGGLGTAVRAMASARVTRIGRALDDPQRFGEPEEGPGPVRRGRRDYPASMTLAEYGRVWFFTRTAGRWRTGNLVETRVEGGPLDGHIVRYMHLAAVHPALAVGGTVAAGQEIGVMGGTGVQRSAPHVHIDVRAPDGQLRDVEALLGLSGTPEPCPGEAPADPPEAPAPATTPAHPGAPPRQQRPMARIPGPSEVAAAPTAPGAAPQAAPARPQAPTGAAADGHSDGGVWRRRARLAACGVRQVDETFESGRYAAHDIEVALPAGARVGVRLARKGGRWRPRLEVLVDGARLYDGRRAARRTPQLRIRAGQAGRRGHLAAVTLQAREAITVRLRVGRWDAGGEPMPEDAAYRLKLERWCRRGSRGNR